MDSWRTDFGFIDSKFLPLFNLFSILKFLSIFLFSLKLIVLVFEYDQSWFISSFCIALPNSSIRFNPSYSHHLWLWEHKCGRSDEIKRSKISWKKQPETTKSMEFFYLLRSQSLLWNVKSLEDFFCHSEPQIPTVLMTILCSLWNCGMMINYELAPFCFNAVSKATYL